MKYKLKDVKSEVEEEVTLGTCELCLSGPFDLTFFTYVFEDENGKTYEIEDCDWSWGDYFTSGLEFINICQFALWLKDVDVKHAPDSPEVGSDYGWLNDLINQFNADTYTVYDMENLEEEGLKFYEELEPTSLDTNDGETVSENPKYLENYRPGDIELGFADGSFEKIVDSDDIAEFEADREEWLEKLMQAREFYGEGDKSD